MPTGYTAKVGDGTVTEFAEYAIQCARNFGALILMRDDPMDAEIPESFEPDNYYRDRVIKLKDELRDVEAMTPEECELAAATEFSNAIEYRTKSIEKYRAIRKRYEAMLDKARRFRPPTADHENFAKFIVEQLEESIKWDCHEDDVDMPRRMSGVEWKESRLSVLKDSLGRAIESHEEEVKRTKDRNEWIRRLRDAIAEVK